MNWLKTRNLPGRGIQTGNLDAANSVADVEKAARLAAFAIDRQRMAERRLDAEAVEYGAENFVVVEAIDQRFIQRDLVGHGAIDHALIQIGGAQFPRSCRRTSCCGCRALWRGDKTSPAAWDKGSTSLRPLCSMVM